MPRYGDAHGKCCGSYSYDSSKSFCHASEVYKLCDGHRYNPVSFLCCYKKLMSRDAGNYSRCCGIESYDR